MEIIIIKNLQICPVDLEPMTWQDAMEKVKTLGEGWRLPNTTEFKEILSPMESMIPNIHHTKLYWTSRTGLDPNKRIVFAFKNNYIEVYDSKNKLLVRPIRNFDLDTAIEILLSDF